MYTLHTVYGRTHIGWHVIDNAETETLAALCGRFDKVCLFVQWEDHTTHAVDMGPVWATIPSYQWADTLDSWLSTVNTPSLPEANISRIGDAACMVYKDLFGYPVTVSTGNHLYASASAIPLGDDIDVVLQGENGIVDMLADKCLFSINGRILPHVQVNDSLYILNGRLVLHTEAEATQTLGTFDLSPLGAWSYLSLEDTEVKVIEQTLRERIRGSVRVRVKTPQPIAGKHVLPIVDGHPLWHRNTVEILDDRHIMLHLNAFNIIEYIARTPIHRRVGGTAMNLRGTGVFVDRQALEEYLTHTPTALVLIDNPDVCRHIEPMGRTDIPGRFSFHYPPKGMLLLDNGTMAEYSLEGWDGDQAAIAITNGKAFTYLHRQTDWGDVPSGGQVGQSMATPQALQGHMVNLYSLHK